MKTAWLFPGSGVHYAGMGQALYDGSAAARETFEEAEAYTGLPFRRLCMGDLASECEQLEIAQAAIVVCSVAAYRTYMQEVGVAPSYIAGHSLGEYSALVAAGALSFADALRLVRLRSQAMEKAASGQQCLVMAVSRLPAAEVRAEVRRMALANEGMADIACLNTADQTVVSGEAAAVREMGAALEARGGRIAYLPIQVPVHSRIMLPAVAQLSEALSGISLHAPRWPVLSNVTASPYGGPSDIRELLAAQLVSPVRWQETVALLQSRAVTHTIELGPKATLTSFTRKIARNLTAFAADDKTEWQSIVQLRPNRGSFYGRCLALAVSSPNRCTSAADYELGVAEPYRRLAELDRSTSGSAHPDAALSEASRAEAFSWLRRILTTKGMSASEQRRRLDQLSRTAEASFN